MSTKPPIGSELRDRYAEGSARLQEEVSANGDGRAAVHGRTELVDSIALRLWNELVSPDAEGPRNLTLLALGGFGRRLLFPHSDIDILCLHAGGGSERELKDQ